MSRPSPLDHPLFFFNDTATTEIYTLSLHDALPICRPPHPQDQPGSSGGGARRQDHRPRHVGDPFERGRWSCRRAPAALAYRLADRESTRLNSRHRYISYAVFFFEKKKKQNISQHLL